MPYNLAIVCAIGMLARAVSLRIRVCYRNIQACVSKWLVFLFPRMQTRLPVVRIAGREMDPDDLRAADFFIITVPRPPQSSPASIADSSLRSQRLKTSRNFVSCSPAHRFASTRRQKIGQLVCYLTRTSRATDALVGLPRRRSGLDKDHGSPMSWPQLRDCERRARLEPSSTART
jgi:DNA-binding transcriptional LysR family regulator